MTNPNADTIIGTVGGTLFAFFLQVRSADMEKTVILTSIAAIVSFGVSHGLKFLVKWFRHKQ